MRHVKKKRILYKTNVEYGDYTVNHVVGCSHRCAYPCYAFLIAHRFGKAKTMQEWGEPALVENALDLLDYELPSLKSKIRFVNLCFTTDPFMVGNAEVTNMSKSIIEKINSFGIPCCVLTKGILPDDLPSFEGTNQYGITLISLDEKFREEIEPGASPIEDRLSALRKLHERGCFTWASIEPFVTPNIHEENLRDILDRVAFVDRVVFGRMHYNRLVTEYKQHKDFYDACVREVVDFCKMHNIHCHIKNKTITSAETLAYCDKLGALKD